MCVSMAKADFTGTKVCLYATKAPGYGNVQVLIYQNTVVSFAGPNAMLLHLPTEAQVGPENFIDTGRFSHILDDMVDAVTPRPRHTMGFGTRGLTMSSVQVFDVGIYTVVLARNAADIPAALHLVPTEKRPALNPDLFKFYERAYPNFAVALCCFNNSKNAQAEPIMVWYRPTQFDGTYRLPAIDCHSGAVPNLYEKVNVDHWLFLATAGMEHGSPVNYREGHAIPNNVRHLLPKEVRGAYFGGPMTNGDFGIRGPEELIWGLNEIERLPPPGYVGYL